jgi:RNA polymerase sigma-70 factor (ECF subfamily)
MSYSQPLIDTLLVLRSSDSRAVDLDCELVRHNRAAFGWALACCRWDRTLAEDVLQNAYLKIIDGRARFGGDADFKGFLFGVIRRTAVEERRRRAVRTALTFGLSEKGTRDPRTVSTDLDQIIRDETSRELVAALERLSSRQRDVLHLVFYQDFTIAAAAEVLSISLGSARVHYERGKAQLRRLLGTV